MKVVIAKCIGCKSEKEIKENEIPEGEQLCCDKCGMPMIANRAKIRLE